MTLAPVLTDRATLPARHRSRVAGAVDVRVVDPIGRVPGLLQWYAARYHSGKVDGNSCPTVPDLSGNGNTLTGATGPTYKTGANGLNGVPVYQFGSNLEVQGSGRILPLDDFTMFIVVYNWTAGRPFGLENSGSGTHGLGLFLSGTTYSWVIRKSGTTLDVAWGTDSGLATSVQGLRSGGSRIDGLTRIGGGGYRTGNSGYSDASVNFTLGSSGSANADMTGSIAEAVTFNRKLSTDEFLAIQAHLVRTYQLIT